MSISFDLSLVSGFFSMPISVVDKYMDLASHTELQVLLYMLRHGEGLTHKGLLSDLHITEPILQSALEAWITRGVLAIQNGKVAVAPPTMDFVPIHQEGKSTRRPSYSFVEIENSLSQNPSLRSVLQAGQGILERSFSQTEYEILYALHDYYGISPEAIMLLFSHCAETGKKSAKAIESVAITWYKQEISTSAEAEAYIQKYRDSKQGERIVRSCFGLGERKLTPKEKDFIARWFHDFGFGKELIELAYNKCVDTIGRLTFGYIDKILEGYRLAGVTTVEAALALPAPERKSFGKKSKEPDREASFDLNTFSDWAFQSVYGNLTDKKEGGHEVP